MVSAKEERFSFRISISVRGLDGFRLYHASTLISIIEHTYTCCVPKPLQHSFSYYFFPHSTYWDQSMNYTEIKLL